MRTMRLPRFDTKFHATILAVSLILPWSGVVAHPGFPALPDGRESRRMCREALLDELDLSEVQRDAVWAIVSEERASLGERQRRAREQMRRLRALSPDDPDFLSAVEDAAAAAAAIAREAVRHTGRIRLRIYTETNLTEAQKRHLDVARNRRCESLPLDLAQRADLGG